MARAAGLATTSLAALHFAGYHGGMSARYSPPDKVRKPAISVEAALDIVLASVAPLPVTELPVEEAIEFTLADPIAAQIDLPGERLAAMDGFAIRTDGPAGDTRRVVASTMAGEPVWRAALAPGAAVRIMTGASVPVDADTVVPLEDVIEVDGEIHLDRVTPGANIRGIGSEIAAGTTIANAGDSLGWPQMALLIALGVHTVRVYRRPRLAVISTGDELEKTIPDSNGPMLTALLRSTGVEVRRHRAADTPTSLEQILDQARDVDAFVISGGISAGDRDVVRQFLHEHAEVRVSQVRMKPGRPFTFGVYAGRPLFALPGTPFAAAATCLQFVSPALDRMRGRTINAAGTVEVGFTLDTPGQRRHIVPVQLDKHRRAERIRPGVAGLGALAVASGLLVIPESIQAIAPGDCLTYWPITQTLGEGSDV